MLLDAARLQEEEARFHARTREKRGEKAENAAPLYSLLDAMDVFDRFGRIASYGAAIELAPGLRATFFDAGHILGSASVLVEAEEGGEARKILFSGDIGNYGRPLLRDPDPPENVDVAIMETTYGDRLHRSPEATLEEFYEALNEAFQRGGNVIIPTFALGARAGCPVLPARGRGKEQAAAILAGLPGFADGHLGHGDLPQASRMLRPGDGGAARRAASIPSGRPDCISAARRRTPSRSTPFQAARSSWRGRACAPADACAIICGAISTAGIAA